FDINSQRRLPGRRDQSQTVRGREVKVEGWSETGCGHYRFSTGFVGESQTRRFDIQVTAQEHPEQSVTDDESVAIEVELEPVSPFAFAVGQRPGKPRQIGDQLVQPGTPDVNFVAGQIRVGGWGPPARFRSALWFSRCSARWGVSHK